MVDHTGHYLNFAEWALSLSAVELETKCDELESLLRLHPKRLTSPT